jgi:hypothetical protein
MTSTEIRRRIERAVGSVLRPTLECTPTADERAIVDAIMAAVEDGPVERCSEEPRHQREVRQLNIPGGTVLRDHAA